MILPAQVIFHNDHGEDGLGMIIKSSSIFEEGQPHLLKDTRSGVDFVNGREMVIF